MEYNKNRFQKINDHKVLHKVKKQWVVLSMSMLALLGGGAVAEHVTAHADTANKDQKTANATDVLKNQINTGLQKAQRTASDQHPQTASSLSADNVAKQADVLHNRILQNAALTQPSLQDQVPRNDAVQANDRDKVDFTPASNAKANSSQLSNQAGATMNAPVLNIKDSTPTTGTYQGLNYTYDPVSSTVEFTGGTSTWSSGDGANDFISVNGGSSPAPSFMKAAKHIKFDNGVDFPTLSSGSGNASLMYFIANDPNVESIYMGSNLATGTAHQEASPNDAGIFASDYNLRSLTIPTGMFAQWSNQKGAFSNDNKLSDLNILPSPISWGSTMFNSNANLPSKLASQVVGKKIGASGGIYTSGSIQNGTYDGLKYVYDPSTSTLEFIGGSLTWNSGVGTKGNYGNQQFIGNADENPSKSYGQDAPACMNQAKHIIFHNVDGSNILSSGNFRYFIASAPHVESIDLGSDFDSGKVSGDFGGTMAAMFNSDANLQEVDVPNYFVTSWDNAGSIFSDDPKLNMIKVYPNPSSAPSNYPSGLQFASNDGISGNWYKISDTKKTNPIQIGNGSTYLQPGATYVNANYVPPLAGNVWTGIKEGTANVKIDGTDDTITVSDGTLSDTEYTPSGTDAGRYQEFMSDLKYDGGLMNSDTLPNQRKDWKIVFHNVTAPQHMNFMFAGGKNSHHHDHGYTNNAVGNQVSSIDLSGLNTSGTTDMTGMLINNDNLQHVDFGNIDTSHVTDMSMMLGSDALLQSADLSNLSGASLTDLWDLFDTDPKLTSVKLSAKFSPRGSNVNAGEMFASDPSLPFAGISWNGYNTSNVTQMYGFFRNDQSLGNVDLPASFDTSNVWNFGQDPKHGYGNDGMFQSDGAAKGDPKGTQSIDLSHANFNTGNAKAMDAMFGDDKNLHAINFGNKFNTSKVSSANLMFGYSDAISDLNLPAGFDTRKMTNTANMFESDVPDGGLKTIHINSSDTKLPDNVWSWGNHSFYQETGATDPHGTPVTKFGGPHDFTTGETGVYTVTPHVKDTVNIVDGPSGSSTLSSSDVYSSTTPANPQMKTITPPAHYTFVAGTNPTISLNGTAHNLEVQTTNVVDYMYKGLKIASDFTPTGVPGQTNSIDWSNAAAAKMPANWKLANDGTQNFTYGPYNTVHDVNVVPDTANDTMDYQYNGRTITSNSAAFSGNSYGAGRSASDRSFVIGSSPAGLSAGYYIQNPAASYDYDGGSHDVPIQPDSYAEHVHYVVSDNPAYVDHGSSAGSYATSLNDDRAVSAGSLSLSINSGNHPGFSLSGYNIASSYTFSHTTNSNGQSFSDMVDVDPEKLTEHVEYFAGSTPEGSDTTDFTGYYGNQDAVTTSKHPGLKSGFALTAATTGFTYGNDGDVIKVPVKEATPSYIWSGYQWGNANVTINTKNHTITIGAGQTSDQATVSGDLFDQIRKVTTSYQAGETSHLTGGVLTSLPDTADDWKIQVQNAKMQIPSDTDFDAFDGRRGSAIASQVASIDAQGLNVRSASGSYKLDYFMYDLPNLRQISLGSSFLLHRSKHKWAPVSNIFSMNYMFAKLPQLKSLDFYRKVTGGLTASSDVNDVQGMFESDYALTSLNLGPNFYTSGVSDMSKMFKSDHSLQTLHIGQNFTTSDSEGSSDETPLRDMSQMFMDDRSLQSLDLTDGNSDSSNLETYRVNSKNNLINMEGLFAGDTNLERLNPAGINPNYIHMSVGGTLSGASGFGYNDMFKGDANLYELTLLHRVSFTKDAVYLDPNNPNVNPLSDTLFKTGMYGDNSDNSDYPDALLRDNVPINPNSNTGHFYAARPLWGIYEDLAHHGRTVADQSDVNPIPINDSDGHQDMMPIAQTGVSNRHWTADYGNHYDVNHYVDGKDLNPDYTSSDSKLGLQKDKNDIAILHDYQSLPEDSATTNRNLIKGPWLLFYVAASPSSNPIELNFNYEDPSGKVISPDHFRSITAFGYFSQDSFFYPSSLLLPRGYAFDYGNGSNKTRSDYGMNYSSQTNFQIEWADPYPYNAAPLYIRPSLARVHVNYVNSDGHKLTSDWVDSDFSNASDYMGNTIRLSVPESLTTAGYQLDSDERQPLEYQFKSNNIAYMRKDTHNLDRKGNITAGNGSDATMDSDTIYLHQSKKNTVPMGAPVTIKYINQSGNVVETQAFTGRRGDSIDVVGEGDENVPQGYQLNPDQKTTYRYGKDPYTVYLDVTGQRVTHPIAVERVEKQSDGTSRVDDSQTKTVSGPEGSTQEINPADFCPKGYVPDYTRDSVQFMMMDPAKNAMPNKVVFYYDDKTTDAAPVTLHYLDQAGHFVGASQILHGDDGDRVTIKGSRAQFSDHNQGTQGESVNAPAGYSLNDQKTITFGQSPQNVLVHVAGHRVSSKVFHLNVTTTDADGSHPQTHQLKLQVSGQVGDDFRVSPFGFTTGSGIQSISDNDLPGQSAGSFQTPAGYHVTPSDSDVDVQVTANGLSQSEARFTYRSNDDVPAQLDTVRIHYYTGTNPEGGHEVDEESDEGYDGRDTLDLRPYLNDIPESVSQFYDLAATSATDINGKPLGPTLSFSQPTQDVYIKISPNNPDQPIIVD